ncbi:MAG: peptidase [Deltaproteobacteria bacterium]|nr:peptidase [Deltaproteobacteria bacterium]
MKMSRMLRSILLFPLAIFMGVDGGDPPAGDPPSAADPPAADPPAGDPPAADPPAGDPDPDSPEEKAKAEADAKAADAAKLVGAPEAYTEFKVPKGAVMPDGFFEAYTPIVKDFNLSQEGAQALFDRLTTDLQPKMIAAQQEKWEGVKTAWAEATKVDKEIGGTAYDANVAIAQRALNTFATPELKQALSDYGMGNHPEMVRLMLRIGKAMREDSVIQPDGSGGDGDKAKLKSLYPTMDK